MRSCFGVLLLTLSGGAFAAVPPAVESALLDALTAVATVGVLSLNILAALVAFTLMRRAIGGGAAQPGPGNYASLGDMYDDLDPNK